MANKYYDDSLSAKRISSELDNFEAARTGFFVFVVDDLDNIIKATYKGEKANAADSDKIARAQEYLKLNVVSSSVPHFSLEPLEYRRGNDVVKFAGVPSFKDGSLKVNDVIGLDTKSILMAWKGLAYNVYTRKGGRMKDYKKTCTLMEYTQDFELVRSWTMYGCWISDLDEDGFDVENDGRRQISATIQYDRAEMEMPAAE